MDDGLEVEVLEGVVEEVAVAEALNVPDAVSEPEIDCVDVLEGVLVAVVLLEALAVAVLVPVEVATAAPTLPSRISHR